MKKIYPLLLLLSCGVLSAFAQLSFTTPNTKAVRSIMYLDAPTFDTSKYLNLKSAILFNKAGLNLNKYDFSNPEINKAIYTVTTRSTENKKNKIIGFSLLAVSVPILIKGVDMTRKKQDLSAYVKAFGVVTLSISGLYLIALKSDKEKSKKAFLKVSQYYKANKLL